jgi:2',5'-phosphodiesterase
VVREVPLPSLAELGGYLPSQRFPSDHLPIVFDLRFKAADGGSSGASSDAAGGGPAAPAGGVTGGGGGGGSATAAAGNVLPAAMYNVGAAVEALQRAEVLAVPTDTLYGLAACAKSSRAVAHIYATKRRGDHKPLAICVADIADVARFADTEVGAVLAFFLSLHGVHGLGFAQQFGWLHSSDRCLAALSCCPPPAPLQHLPPGLVEELLPGPVTLLLTRRADAPLAAELNPGVGAIGVRIPDSPFIRAICRQHRGALALTSANISGGMSSIAVDEFQVGGWVGGWVCCGGRCMSAGYMTSRWRHSRAQRNVLTECHHPCTPCAGSVARLRPGV